MTTEHNPHSILARLRETDFNRMEALARLQVVERGERTAYERELEGHVRSLVEQLEAAQSALPYPAHALTEARVRAKRAEEQLEALREKPNQPLLNAARRLVKATDDAERNYALGNLYNALVEDGSSDGLGTDHLHSFANRRVLDGAADRALPDLASSPATSEPEAS